MGFMSWLLRQRYRQDQVGRIAREACLDPTWPNEISDPGELRDYLEMTGAEDPALEAAGRAWAEWAGLTYDRGERLANLDLLGRNA